MLFHISIIILNFKVKAMNSNIKVFILMSIYYFKYYIYKGIRIL